MIPFRLKNRPQLEALENTEWTIIICSYHLILILVILSSLMHLSTSLFHLEFSRTALDPASPESPAHVSLIIVFTAWVFHFATSQEIPWILDINRHLHSIRSIRWIVVMKRSKLHFYDVITSRKLQLVTYYLKLAVFFFLSLFFFLYKLPFTHGKHQDADKYCAMRISILSMLPFHQPFHQRRDFTK